MLKLLAAFVTVIACSMAAAAAWDRGGNLVDRFLLVAISLVIVLAVHLLPGLSKRPITWLIWVACFLGAVYGHLTFLTHASLRASQARSEQSAQALGTQKQIEIVENELAGIKARSISRIVADLAVMDKWSLRVELNQARRAQKLKEQLAALYASNTSAKVVETQDPVIVKLAVTTGLPVTTLSVAIGLVLSILVELVGALLWHEALKIKGSNEVVTVVTDTVTTVTDTVMPSSATVILIDRNAIETVREAIRTGQCRNTVAAIRSYLSCSQDKAMQISREIRCAAV